MWKQINQALRTNILVGIFLVTPVVVTLWIIYLLFTKITNLFLSEHWLESPLAMGYRLLALILVFCALYLIGLLGRNIIGRTIYELGDRIMSRIPVIRSLYLSLRHIGKSLVSTRSTMFKQVVAVQFPRPGVYAIAFVTSAIPRDFMGPHPEVNPAEEWTAVFMPTAPNPTTGFLLVMPRRDLIPLNVSVTMAMKMIMSAGAVGPAATETGPGSSFMEQLEKWANHSSPAPDRETLSADARATSHDH